MVTYAETVKAMAAFETFDPAAFLSNESCPQNVCNFIVALAAAHNDLNDLHVAMHLLSTEQPSSPVTRTIPWAKHNGVSLHITRAILATTHEILRLVKDNPSVVGHPYFLRVVKKLPREVKPYWAAMCATATTDRSDNPVAKYLAYIRDKISSHFDLKMIGSGYRRKFLDGQTESPLLSRGNNAQKARFYFADAALEEVVFLPEDKATVRRVITGNDDIFSQVNIAIFHLVVAFIAERGAAFRTYVDIAGSVPPSPMDRN